MEILGLAIVVILLILGMVFVIKFVALKPQSTIKKDVVESQVASNYISTYLDITVPNCNSLTVKELLQDCAAGSSIDCNGMTSCAQSQQVADIIFTQTFDEWKWDYYFVAFLQESSPLWKLSSDADGRPCPGPKKSKTYPLPTRVGTLSVRLDLCN